jgi:hypothetical protein
MLLTDPIFWGILIFGIWSSYTDIKKGKIKNLTVIFIIGFGLGINLYFGGNIFLILLNSGLSFIVGYLLWEFGFWSPGDAKLFTAFSFLIPLSIYKQGSIPFFPSYIILVNTFVPVAIFFLFYSIIKLNIKNLKEKLGEIFTLPSLSGMIIFILGFSVIFEVINQVFNFEINRIFQIILMLVISETSLKFKESHFKIFLILVTILLASLFPTQILSLGFLIGFLFSFITFQFLRLLLSNLDQFSLKEEVKIGNLEPKMILAEDIIKMDDEYVKYSTPIITYFDIIRTVRKRFSARFRGKLSEEDVNKIHSLRDKNKIKFDTIKISKTIPFSPFIFMGVIITYLLKGSLGFLLIVITEYFSIYFGILYFKTLLLLGLI